MKTKPGQYEYPMPKAFYRIAYAQVRSAAMHYDLCQISPTEFEILKSDPHRRAWGMPRYFSDWGAQGIAVWPTPDGQYKLDVGYYPPLKIA